jgi:hypothetical protein
MRAKLLMVGVLLACLSLMIALLSPHLDAQPSNHCFTIRNIPCAAPPASTCSTVQCMVGLGGGAPTCSTGGLQYAGIPTRPICNPNQASGKTTCDSNYQTNPARTICITQTPCDGGPCVYNNNQMVFICQGPAAGATPAAYVNQTFVTAALGPTNCP